MPRSKHKCGECLEMFSSKREKKVHQDLRAHFDDFSDPIRPGNVIYGGYRS